VLADDRKSLAIGINTSALNDRALELLYPFFAAVDVVARLCRR